MNQENKIISYVLGELSPYDKTAFESELRNNQDLRKEVDVYTEMMEGLGDMPTAYPSKRLKDRFDTMLVHEMSQIAQKPQPRIFNIQVKYYKMIAVAASVMLFGFWLGSFLNSGSVDGMNHSLANEELLDRDQMIHLVNQQKTSQRISGVNMITQAEKLDDELIKTLKEVLYTDPSANVRLAAVESLSFYSHQKEVKELLQTALLEVDIPIVRISIIGYLTGMGEQSTVPHFEKLLDDQDLDRSVRDELHAGIVRLM